MCCSAALGASRSSEGVHRRGLRADGHVVEASPRDVRRARSLLRRAFHLTVPIGLAGSSACPAPSAELRHTRTLQNLLGERIALHHACGEDSRAARNMKYNDYISFGLLFFPSLFPEILRAIAHPQCGERVGGDRSRGWGGTPSLLIPSTYFIY